MIGWGKFSLTDRDCDAARTCAKDLAGGGDAAVGSITTDGVVVVFLDPTEEGAVGAANSASQSNSAAGNRNPNPRKGQRSAFIFPPSNLNSKRILQENYFFLIHYCNVLPLQLFQIICFSLQ